VATRPKNNGTKANGKSGDDVAVHALYQAERALLAAEQMQPDAQAKSARRALVHILAALANNDSPELERLEALAARYLDPSSFKPSKNPRHSLVSRFAGSRFEWTEGGRTWRLPRRSPDATRPEVLGELLDLVEIHVASFGPELPRLEGLAHWWRLNWTRVGITSECPSETELEYAVDVERKRARRLRYADDPVRIWRGVIAAAFSAAGIYLYPAKPDAEPTPIRDVARSWTRAIKRDRGGK
jgi:hypothetical protein